MVSDFEEIGRHLKAPAAASKGMRDASTCYLALRNRFGVETEPSLVAFERGMRRPPFRYSSLF